MATMSVIAKRRTARIVAVHTELAQAMRVTLEKAIEIGQLLTEQKEEMEHGDFTAWIADNLPFTDRTARNYMRAFRNRDTLKTESVSDLTGAYRLLTVSTTPAGRTHEEIIEWAEELLDDWQFRDFALKEGSADVQAPHIEDADKRSIDQAIDAAGPEDLQWLVKLADVFDRLQRSAAEAHLRAMYLCGKIQEEIQEWNAAHPDDAVVT